MILFNVPVTRLAVALAAAVTLHGAGAQSMELVKPVPTPGVDAPPRTKLPKLMEVVTGSCPEPVYPAESLRAEQTGIVDMAFLIDVKGNVLESKILRSSGFNLLNETAKLAFEKCKFARIDHAPIQKPTWTSWTYSWSLE